MKIGTSSSSAPLRTVALHAMYDTEHRALINQVRRDEFVRGCVGVDVPYVSVSFSLPGIICFCLSATPHFLEFHYAICVDGYLRGRHPIRSSCSLKIGTMKARIEVRLDYCSFACNVRNGAPCSYQ